MVPKNNCISCIFLNHELVTYVQQVISVVGILGSIVYAIYLIATRGFHVSFFENHLVNSTTNGTNYNSGNVEWTWSDIGWDWMYGVVVVLYVILLCFRIQFTLNLLRTCGWVSVSSDIVLAIPLN